MTALALLCLAAAPPDVLLIVSDDLTATTLGCYGNEVCRTPNIDALAARGAVFERAYCQFPVCGPSRAAMMSGCYPAAVGVVGNGSAARFAEAIGDRPTLPMRFSAAGYHAARVSKIYHMLIPGNITEGVAGPDHAASWDSTFNAQSDEWFSPGEKTHYSSERLNFDRDRHYRLGFGTAFYEVRLSTDGAEQADEQAVREAGRILRQTPADQPLFLAVGLIRPHVPLVAPAAIFDHYPPESVPLPDVPDGDLDDIPKPGRGRVAGAKLSKESNARGAMAAYYACVEYMDANVGRLLKSLEESGRADNTLVVFCSDHGYHLGEHGMWSKLHLHEESARIPLIVAGPDVPAARHNALAEQIDLYPTLCDYAGLDTPDWVQGRSLMPVIRGEAESVREAAFSTVGRGDLVRTDRFAYMRYNDGGEELYDMRADPKQHTNLAADATFEADRSRLSATLDEHLAGLP